MDSPDLLWPFYLGICHWNIGGPPIIDSPVLYEHVTYASTGTLLEHAGTISELPIMDSPDLLWSF